MIMAFNEWFKTNIKIMTKENDVHDHKIKKHIVCFGLFD